MRYWMYIVTLIGLPCLGAEAQRVNFKSFVQDESIQVTLVNNPEGLNFNLAKRVLEVNDPNVYLVNLFDFPTVVVEIDAPIEYDLTIELSLPSGITLGGLNVGTPVPVNLRYAYNNTGELSDAQRRTNAVEVPSVFNTLTLPVRRRRPGGPPLPPPTPEHGGYLRPRGKAYVYFYGSIGPIPGGIPAGNYSAEIQMTINYADNTF
jgi:hypothetical protein